MRVLVAGGSGTIGVPLVRALVGAGHQVTALSRSADRHTELRAIGAVGLAVDALDPDALRAAVAQARPTHVIHQLTALPQEGPRRGRDIEATNRLRIEGTRHLLDASIRAGVERMVVGSFAILAHAAETGAPASAAADAVQCMERQVIEASARGAIQGVVLRYGMFYGRQVPSTRALVDRVRRRRMPVISGDAGQLPFVHIDDAVSATVRALERGAPGSTFDVVDDRAVSFSEFVGAVARSTDSPTPWSMPAWVARLLAPDMARMLAVRLPLANAPARTELGWRPHYPTVYDALTGMLRNAA